MKKLLAHVLAVSLTAFAFAQPTQAEGEFARGLVAFVEQDFAKAATSLDVVSLRHDQRLGHPQADFLLGKIYAYGLLGSVDEQRAISHLRLAAKTDHVAAQRLLGDRLIDRRDTSTQLEAAHWYARAAKAGDGYAIYRLAGLFEYGIAFEQNQDTARQWYQRALSVGEPLGQIGLDRLERRELAEELRNFASRWKDSKPVFVSDVTSVSVPLPVPQTVTLTALPTGTSTTLIQPAVKLAALCKPLEDLTEKDRRALKRARLFNVVDRPAAWNLINQSAACQQAPNEYGSLVKGGYFAPDPTDMSLRRSVRTNNPGALNISTRRWERVIPGFAGVHRDDGRGNKTVIYHTPEYGVMALYLLLTEIYNFAETGVIDVERLAIWYGGRGRKMGLQYLKAWDRFSPRDLRDERYLDIDDEVAMMDLLIAIAAFEIGKPSPLSREQFRLGIQMAQELQHSASEAPEALVGRVVGSSNGG